MTPDALKISCEELRELAEIYPQETEIIVEMLIEAEEELCLEQQAA